MPTIDRPAHVVVLGSANMDLVGLARRLPLAGETVLGTSFSRHAGGKGANQAVAAARAGAQTVFAGAIGDDPFGDELARSLRNAGVNTAHLRTARGVATGIALIVVDNRGNNQITVLPGANSQVGEIDISALRRVLTPASLLLLQLEIPVETVVRAACIAHGIGATVVLNPAPAAPLPDELLACVDVLVPNEHEARSLTGTHDDEPVETVAARLQSRGPAVVVVTMGAAGALVLDGDGMRMTPAFPVTAVDTTAAGDAFVGGLAAAHAEGKSLDDAVRFAAATAALSVQRRGAQESMPARTDIDAFIASEPA